VSGEVNLALKKTFNRLKMNHINYCIYIWYDWILWHNPNHGYNTCIQKHNETLSTSFFFLLFIY